MWHYPQQEYSGQHHPDYEEQIDAVNEVGNKRWVTTTGLAEADIHFYPQSHYLNDPAESQRSEHAFLHFDIVLREINPSHEKLTLLNQDSTFALIERLHNED